VSRRAVAALGLGVAALYIAGAAWSAHLDPLDRRPLLDGLAPPPAYRWVEPPPALAPQNVAPDAKRVTLSERDATYDPKTGSAPGVYATDDFQATLTLAARAIPPRAAASEVELRILPSAPSPDPVVPDGYRIAGNVIEVTATYRPTGGDVTKLAADAQLLLSYPAIFGGVDDTVLASTDGIAWTALESTNHLGQQLVVANIDRLGMFAVGQTSGSSPGSAAGDTEAVPGWLIGVLVALGVIAALTAIAARRGSSGSVRR
jgi:hypothetical protein